MLLVKLVLIFLSYFICSSRVNINNNNLRSKWLLWKPFEKTLPSLFFDSMLHDAQIRADYQDEFSNRRRMISARRLTVITRADVRMWRSAVRSFGVRGLPHPRNSRKYKSSEKDINTGPSPFFQDKFTFKSSIIAFSNFCYTQPETQNTYIYNAFFLAIVH